MLSGAELKRRRANGEVVWEREPERAVRPARPRAAQRPRRGRASAISWGVTGFVLGATFWNFVGIWSFVGGVFLQTPADRAVVPGCTALVLDRDAKITEATPCPGGIALQARKPRAQFADGALKADRAVGVR